jgi:hypothetical protein
MTARPVSLFIFCPAKRRFPRASAGFDLCLTDVNCDRHCDCVAVQNFFSPQIETAA